MLNIIHHATIARFKGCEQRYIAANYIVYTCPLIIHAHVESTSSTGRYTWLYYKHYVKIS